MLAVATVLAFHDVPTRYSNNERKSIGRQIEQVLHITHLENICIGFSSFPFYLESTSNLPSQGAVVNGINYGMQRKDLHYFVHWNSVGSLNPDV